MVMTDLQNWKSILSKIDLHHFPGTQQLSSHLLSFSDEELWNYLWTFVNPRVEISTQVLVMTVLKNIICDQTAISDDALLTVLDKLKLYLPFQSTTGQFKAVSNLLMQTAALIIIIQSTASHRSFTQCATVLYNQLSPTTTGSDCVAALMLASDDKLVGIVLNLFNNIFEEFPRLANNSKLCSPSELKNDEEFLFQLLEIVFDSNNQLDETITCDALIFVSNWLLSSAVEPNQCHLTLISRVYALVSDTAAVPSVVYQSMASITRLFTQCDKWSLLVLDFHLTHLSRLDSGLNHLVLLHSQHIADTGGCWINFAQADVLLLFADALNHLFTYRVDHLLESAFSLSNQLHGVCQTLLHMLLRLLSLDGCLTRQDDLFQHGLAIAHLVADAALIDLEKDDRCQLLDAYLDRLLTQCLTKCQIKQPEQDFIDHPDAFEQWLSIRSSLSELIYKLYQPNRLLNVFMESNRRLTAIATTTTTQSANPFEQFGRELELLLFIHESIARESRVAKLRLATDHIRQLAQSLFANLLSLLCDCLPTDAPGTVHLTYRLALHRLLSTLDAFLALHPLPPGGFKTSFVVNIVKLLSCACLKLATQSDLFDRKVDLIEQAIRVVYNLVSNNTLAPDSITLLFNTLLLRLVVTSQLSENVYCRRVDYLFLIANCLGRLLGQLTDLTAFDQLRQFILARLDELLLPLSLEQTSLDGSSIDGNHTSMQSLSHDLSRHLDFCIAIFEPLLDQLGVMDDCCSHPSCSSFALQCFQIMFSRLDSPTVLFDRLNIDCLSKCSQLFKLGLSLVTLTDNNNNNNNQSPIVCVGPIKQLIDKLLTTCLTLLARSDNQAGLVRFACQLFELFLSDHSGTTALSDVLELFGILFTRFIAFLTGLAKHVAESRGMTDLLFDESSTSSSSRDQVSHPISPLIWLALSDQSMDTARYDELEAVGILLTQVLDKPSSILSDSLFTAYQFIRQSDNLLPVCMTVALALLFTHQSELAHLGLELITRLLTKLPSELTCLDEVRLCHLHLATLRLITSRPLVPDWHFGLVAKLYKALTDTDRRSHFKAIESVLGLSTLPDVRVARQRQLLLGDDSEWWSASERRSFVLLVSSRRTTIASLEQELRQLAGRAVVER